MDKIRGWVGVIEPISTYQTSPATTTKDDVDAAKLLRTNQVKLGQLKSQLVIVQDEIDDAMQIGDDATAKSKMTRRNGLKIQIKQLEAKIENQIAIGNAIATADSNRQQALVVQEGAYQLESIVAETEKIDIHHAVDTFQDNSKATQEFSSRLSEPLYNIEDPTGEQESVDDELRRMKEEAALSKFDPIPKTEIRERVKQKQPNPIKARVKRVPIKEEEH